MSWQSKGTPQDLWNDFPGFVGIIDLHNPQHPWDWYIYIHLPTTNIKQMKVNIPYMDAMGKVVGKKTQIVPKWWLIGDLPRK